MALPLQERLTGAAYELSSVLDSTARGEDVRLSRIHAGCLVYLLIEATAAVSRASMAASDAADDVLKSLP